MDAALAACRDPWHKLVGEFHSWVVERRVFYRLPCQALMACGFSSGW